MTRGNVGVSSSDAGLICLWVGGPHDGRLVRRPSALTSLIVYDDEHRRQGRVWPHHSADGRWTLRWQDVRWEDER